MSRFVMRDDVEIATFDWGSEGIRVAPSVTGCATFVVMDVTFAPGGSHAFHLHPHQDELIVVTKGRIVQYLEQEARELGPGDSVYVDRGVVHGSYNDFAEQATLQVVLGPPRAPDGYEAADVSGDEPWVSVR